MSIAERLQELRKQNNYSQEQLAEKLGVTRQAVSKWESEQGNPDINNIIKLSEIYNVSTDYLLKGEVTIPEVNSEKNSHNQENNLDIFAHSSSKNTMLHKACIILLLFAGISFTGVLFILTLGYGAKKLLGGH